MTRVEWRRVWSLFEEVVLLPADQQSDFLGDACGDDDALRQAVENMLEADRKANKLLDQPIVARPEPAGEATATVRPPTAADRRLPAEAIGPYRLLRKVGEGGMSTVYLAVRDDDTFRRRVVVKLIRRGLETEAMIHRLQVERQILAGLTHPNIARLYDGGTTEKGMPYFVMEYIEGETIDLYCARNGLTIDDRITLFMKVCDAVRYAHQNLVVHRDLKPANIMVAEGGEPKLLDFGIAKLLNPELIGEAVEPTVTWQGALTPSYASPEQIRGKRITTASDVYSLGVVLYRLLTGQLPFDFKGLSPTEIERLVTETEPTKPSAAVAHGTDDDVVDCTPARLRALGRAIAGDIDAIVLKALRSTTAERYSSVEQLAADLQRCQRGLPVTARQGTWRYRAAKFVRRNRLPVLTGALAGVVLTVLGATIVWQSAQVTRERDEARRENQKKAQVSRLLMNIFELSNPFVRPGAELTVREALEHSTSLFASRLHDQPDVRAELLHTTGSLRAVIGDYEQAATELQTALTLRRDLRGDQHIDPITTASSLAGVYANLGDLDRAESLAREAVANARRLVQTTGDNAALIPPLAKLVTVRCYRGRYAAAKQPAYEAWELLQQVPATPEREIEILEYLGSIHSAEGEYDQAKERYQQAIDLRREHEGEAHPAQINALGNLAVVLFYLGEFDRVETLYREVLALQRANFGDDVRDPITYFNLAGLYSARDDHAQAEVALRQALEQAGGAESDSYLILPIELSLANTRLAQGHAREAEAMLRRIVAEATAELGSDHWRVAIGRSILGASISIQGRLREAEPLLTESHERLSDGAKARYRDRALERLRRHLERAGRLDEIAAYEKLHDGSGPPPA